MSIRQVVSSPILVTMTMRFDANSFFLWIFLKSQGPLTLIIITRTLKAEIKRCMNETPRIHAELLYEISPEKYECAIKTVAAIY